MNILGTSHIAQQSIREIKKAFSEFQPQIVAVELDSQRAFALIHEEKSRLNLSAVFQIGLKGYLFAKIGQYLQQKLGQSVGVSPGSEMKTAIELAQKDKLQLELIDQPIQITLKRFSKTFSWKEKFQFIKDIFQGLLFPKKQLKKLGLDQFDLSHVPEKELIVKMVAELKKSYPNVYKTLVEERNHYMVKRLVKLQKDNPDKKILAIVGAGHVAGMKELLLKIDIVR